MESASSGLLAGRNAVRRLEGKAPLILPITTMMGSLAEHAAHSPSKDFQPMGANFGILPVIEPHIRDKKERYAALSARALEDLAETLKNAVIRMIKPRQAKHISAAEGFSLYFRFYC